MTSQLTDDRLLTIERDDCVDGTLPQTSVVKPAKRFTIHSTLVLKKICALRSEKRREWQRLTARLKKREGT